MTFKIAIKRVYDGADPDDGYRILVDRLWPRGISKDVAAIDEWLKELAPSADLRKWFDHRSERFEEFEAKYLVELKSVKSELDRVRFIAAEKQVTLVYGARDLLHNQAVVLRNVLAQE
ncbi:UNVERIFIED_CONTAM: hypothetical protein GTU68_060309 [Idotea baltica]|nr:hypothetical protein [Idotea baltica]